MFAGQTFNGWWAALSWLIVLFKSSYRAVVVTDKRIAVFNTGRWAMGNAEAAAAQPAPLHPHRRRRGPVVEDATPSGERLYIHKRFHKDVEAADAKAPRLSAQTARSGRRRLVSSLTPGPIVELTVILRR